MLRARPGRTSLISSPRSVRAGSMRVAWSAGTKAKKAVAAIAASTRNSATRQSAAGTLNGDVTQIDGHGVHCPVGSALEREARYQVSAAGGRQREQPTFGQQLSDNATPRCANRQPDADFPLTRHTAGEQQVRDVLRKPINRINPNATNSGEKTAIASRG